MARPKDPIPAYWIGETPYFKTNTKVRCEWCQCLIKYKQAVKRVGGSPGGIAVDIEVYLHPECVNSYDRTVK